jgi:hypothetical protein
MQGTSSKMASYEKNAIEVEDHSQIPDFLAIANHTSCLSPNI